MAKTKHRYFIFLLYPDSLPEDWLLKLELLGNPMSISPLHDRCTRKSKETGEIVATKIHRHGIYISANPVTTDAVLKKLQRALGDKAISTVKVCDNVEHYYLYLTHESKDAIAKGKVIYDKREIIHLNNFDISRYITMSLEEKKELYHKVVNIAYKNHFANLIELMDYIDVNGAELGIRDMDTLIEVTKGNTGFLRLLFDGNFQRRTSGRNQRKLEE